MADPGLVRAAAFTYHGSLQEAGKPAEGKYDLELTLYTAASGGATIAGPLVAYAVPVHGGAFSTQVNFGALSNISGTAWLGVKVRPAGSEQFAALAARAPVGTDATASVCPGAWTLDGNAGTVPGTGPGQNYLGTADAQPLVFAIAGSQVGKISASTDAAFPDAINVVLGSPANSLGPVVGGAVIGGGGSTESLCGLAGNLPCLNSVSGRFATVSGGVGNYATEREAVIGGGASNEALAIYATVGGGELNSADSVFATVGGGFENTASDQYAVVGGGYQNGAGNEAVVAGGAGNHANGLISAVCGGAGNAAIGTGAMVVGGQYGYAGGDYSFVSGFDAHVRDSVEAGSAADCASSNTCGDFGTFVWSDKSGPQFTSTAPNQFLVHAVGGAGINTNRPAAKALTVAGPDGPIAVANFAPNPLAIGVFENNGRGYIEALVPVASETGLLFSLIGSGADGGVIYNSGSNPNGLSLRTGGNVTRLSIDNAGGIYVNRTSLGTGVFQIGSDATNGNGAHLTAGGAWVAGSSRTFKEAFAAVDAGSILDKVLTLPVTTWFYRNDHAEGLHMGPMAEDFAQSFGLGGSDKYISTTDESGVAFAAIQGLNRKLEAENAALRAEVAQTRAQIEDVRAVGRAELDAVLARLRRLENAAAH